ncbi:hypothetical protein BGZ83_008585 [Gryganskiella cystojenkinii]|nr:hypothetical protein BGZ83_008585 [Gryganskiella cystojenkinii]
MWLDQEIKERFGIESDIVQGLLDHPDLKDHIDTILEGATCQGPCKRQLDRHIGVFTKGASIERPLYLNLRCCRCNGDTLNQSIDVCLERWVSRVMSNHPEDFKSREKALMTILTVVCQGYCVGEPFYTDEEFLQLKFLARYCVPCCFSCGKQLDIAQGVSPRTRFSTDRLIFSSGVSLGYNHHSQIVVASCLFDNCFLLNRTIQERVNYLTKIQQEMPAGAPLADLRIVQTQNDFNHEVEIKREFSPETNRGWKAFCDCRVENGKSDRIVWSKEEYRFFLEKADSTSAVTCLKLKPGEGHIDRVCNSDAYTLSTCLFMEAGLNFAKQYLPEFKTSKGKEGLNLPLWGARILRNDIWKLIQQAESRSSRWEQMVTLMRANPFPIRSRLFDPAMYTRKLTSGVAFIVLDPITIGLEILIPANSQDDGDLEEREQEEPDLLLHPKAKYATRLVISSPTINALRVKEMSPAAEVGPSSKVSTARNPMDITNATLDSWRKTVVGATSEGPHGLESRGKTATGKTAAGKTAVLCNNISSRNMNDHTAGTRNPSLKRKKISDSGTPSVLNWFLPSNPDRHPNSGV